jgi:pimeloyl-ACP methyl ester carboxylesterase
MADLSYGAMERSHGIGFSGPGFRALDPDGPGPTPDPAAEPVGYLVVMDGAVRIHFLDWCGATGDTERPLGILAVHGLAQTAWTWSPVARRLRAFAHVVAMDLRGHGLSDAPSDGYDRDQLVEDAIAVAEGAGLLAYADEAGAGASGAKSPFVVAGHGFGAAVAAWTASALGDRCAGLVLVDGGWTNMPDETEMSPDEWRAAIAEPPEVLRSAGAWLADRRAFDPPTWDPDQERAARAEVVETAAGRVKPAIHGHALAASVAALWTYVPLAVLPAVQAEVVALAARDDDGGRHHQALREAAAARLAAGRTRIRAAAYPALGHNLMRYVPDAVGAAIRASARPGTDTGADASR